VNRLVDVDTEAGAAIFHLFLVFHTIKGVKNSVLPINWQWGGKSWVLWFSTGTAVTSHVKLAAAPNFDATTYLRPG
jgi:hypothetical protein